MTPLAPTLANFLPLLTRVVRDEGSLGNVGNVGLQTRFVEDLGLDSLTLVALVFICEEEFQVSMVDQGEELAKLHTVGDTLRFLASRQFATS